MNVIVTGASKGIGRGIAEVLSREGHHLGLLARSELLLKEFSQEIKNRAGTAEFEACDLRSFDETERAMLALHEKLGGIDALINNAGLVIRKDVFSISIEEWKALIDTNVNALFYATRAALAFMRKKGRGHIINLSSISGRMPLPGGSAYAASKYAVTGFSESLFQEVRDFGIKVSVIFPGSVDTESHRNAGEDADWKVRPSEVGDACHGILNTAPGNCISRLEIRPLRKPTK